MLSDEPFPLEAVPGRLRNAILKEFQGRCPSIGEVTQIPDKQWLSAPDVGQRYVEMIHDIIDAAQQQTTRPSGIQMTDAELLERVDELQEELRWLKDIVKERISKE
jgi:hypothetical protein